ncbi:MAG TPA: acetyl-CoA carboxylase biotin carboxyl carrier protein subunit [Candidatus Binataceae bacterium]|nr:acetyl-CoA carboxylase biotin carboxyl carrier protein subunit [Candidatus Binataceae bacterium]
MRYIANLAGAAHEFEVEPLGADGGYRLRLGDQHYDLDVRRVGASSFSILIGTRSFDFEVLREGDELVIASRDGVARVALTDPRRRAPSAAARAHQSGRAELRAMMPGRVVNVMVAAGDEVEAGAGVLVVEAMKMENELRAPKSGKVIEVKVTAGQTVEKNDLLVIIE